MRNKNTKNFPQRNQKSGYKNSRDKNIIFGTYIHKNKKELVCLDDREILVLDIKNNIPLPIKNNTKVKALIKYNKQTSKEQAIILASYGPQEDLQTRIEVLIKDAQVDGDFPPDVINSAKKFGPRVSPKETKKRESLAQIPFCTIDGETAKDFDDAVFARKKNKNIEVFVAIADVSYYVQADSALDQEALQRGTSIYYPGACIPMLPEELSNGLCSLRPNVLRLAIVVRFEVGPKGGISQIKITETVIKSQARLTYKEVQKFYDHKLENNNISESIQDSLQNLHDAALVLRRCRKLRGAIDFDIAESVVALDDDGEPTSIHPQSRLESHKIIEDLMVATNEIVARFFERKKVPAIFRVHEPPNPEKLEVFINTIKTLGAVKNQSNLNLANITGPKHITRIMRDYEKSNYKETLNTLLLRAMMQARYGEKNLKHFGLASDSYLHFTSPIRRYADLMVHRQLRNTLFEPNKKTQISSQTMASIAESISDKENKATDVERKIDRLFAATYLANRIGETFAAQIVSCTEFGFFIRIIEHHIEGLVHIATISRSHVQFLPEKLCLLDTGSNKYYRIGDKIRVKLINVSIAKGFIDFELERTAKKNKKY